MLSRFRRRVRQPLPVDLGCCLLAASERDPNGGAPSPVLVCFGAPSIKPGLRLDSGALVAPGIRAGAFQGTLYGAPDLLPQFGLLKLLRKRAENFCDLLSGQVFNCNQATAHARNSLIYLRLCHRI